MIIPWPTGIDLRNVEWSQPPIEQVNRSAWSGRTRIVKIGPAERWTATGDWPQLNTAQARLVRAFQFALRGRLNTFRLPAVEAPQHAAAYTVQVNGAGAAGYTLPLKGLPASTTLLLAGDMITVGLPSGDEQLIGLVAPLTSDASGFASATLATVLRENPANGAGVETRTPYGLMRAPLGAKWAVAPGFVYDHPFIAEEAF